MIDIRISLSGVPALSRSIGFILNANADLTPAWKQVSKHLSKFQKNVFMAKGAGVSPGAYDIPASESLPAWVALRPSTIIGKSNPGRHRETSYKNSWSMKMGKKFASSAKIVRDWNPKWATYPLIRTEKLMNAFTKDSAKGAVRIFEKRWMAWGIDEGEIDYAIYHQYGTRKMRQRVILRIPEQLAKIITTFIGVHILKTRQGVRVNL